MTLNSIQHPTGCRYLQSCSSTSSGRRALLQPNRKDDDDYTRRKDALKPRSSLLNSCQVSSCLFISLIISFSDDGDDWHWLAIVSTSAVGTDFHFRMCTLSWKLDFRCKWIYHVQWVGQKSERRWIIKLWIFVGFTSVNVVGPILSQL